MKISLKNLADATEQQVFDQVAVHLLTQNRKSRLDDSTHDYLGTCAYRGGTNKELSCAAGCLIANDEYNSEMEKHSWSGLVGGNIVPADHRFLIRDLQCVHDNHDIEFWKRELRVAARNWKLDYSILNNY